MVETEGFRLSSSIYTWRRGMGPFLVAHAPTMILSILSEARRGRGINLGSPFSGRPCGAASSAPAVEESEAKPIGDP